MEIDAELRGQSPALAAVRGQVKGLLQRVASGRLPAILIEGETGTGKGLLARMLHRGGPRAGRPFVDVNCAAIPESLLESELFGHEKGAFTDARQAKAGLFQTAHGGTLFLDEVGLLPVALQGKLLKAVEERTVRRLGGTRNEPIDVWMISATSEDLRAPCAEAACARTWPGWRHSTKGRWSCGARLWDSTVPYPNAAQDTTSRRRDVRSSIAEA